MHFVCVGACVQLQYAVCISLHPSLLLVLVFVVVFYVFVWFATKVHYFIYKYGSTLLLFPFFCLAAPYIPC